MEGDGSGVPSDRGGDAAVRLAAIVEGSDDAIVSKTLDGIILSWNPAAERMFGYRADEVVGRPIDLIVPPDRLDEEHQLLARIRAGQRVAHLETERLTRDGARVAVSLSTSPVPGQGGSTTAASTIIRDISVRKRADEALREREERFRSLFESAALGIGHVALDGRFLDVNGTFARIVGYTREELLARRFQDVTHPEDVAADVEGMAALAAGHIPSYRMEKRYIRGDGGIVWVSLSVGLARDTSGRPAYCSFVVEDVTARKRAEDALRASEERFATLAENVPQHVWMADGDGGVFWFNRRSLDYARLPLDELKGWGWQKVLHPEHLASVDGAIRRHLARGDAWELTYPLRRWDGEYRWFLARSVPIRDERGGVIRWLGTGTDVTAAREAERRKDEFLAMLSHELRNPLAPIRHCTAILRRADPTSEQARRARAVIERQSGHLGRLVDDLLDITRIARGKLELRRARVDLRDVITGVAEDLKGTMRERGLELRVTAPPGPAWADADPSRLAQVVGNLLHNAAKFSRRGGTVELELRVLPAHAEISVRDGGAGIDASLLPHLFDAFVQGERTLARSEGGLGLGLALVKAISELHGGSVRAESAGVGRGATFVVRLPLAEPPPREVVEPPARSGAAAGRRILVVDDNRDGADSLAELLRFLGHHVEVAYDGPSALEKARASGADAVVCDLGLPGMTGFEVARALRAGGSGARLIALSGYARPEDVTASREAGFDGHLAKPCDVEDVERLLATPAGAAGA